MSYGVPEPPAPGGYGHQPGFDPLGPGPIGHEATGGYQLGHHQPELYTGPQYRPEEPPKAYVVHNIIGILGCLSVLGIIGLVFALQVSSQWRMGEYAGARGNARAAKILGIISLVGFVPVALFVLLILFGVSLAIFA